MTALPTAKFERLVNWFIQECDILIDNIQNKGWQKFRTNYLREVVGVKHGETFSNTHSPAIEDEARRRRPDLKNWIIVKPRKKRK